MRLIALLLLPTALSAQDLLLDLPIACALGQDCHIQQFLDHDPSGEASDFRCGALTYDGHKGTDFALPSLAAQAEGVDVLAAAGGIIAGTRDGMDDILQGRPDAPNVIGRECGNGVVIRHAGGWETQYCHMRRGTVQVAEGDTVAAGDVLGQVGLSGQTQFPHVHLSVRKDGTEVDPFDPDGSITCGAPSQDTLWRDRPDTPASGLIAAGFWNDAPDYDDVKAGTSAIESLQPGDAMVLWGYAFGSQPGDLLSLTIDGPGGEVFSERVTLDRTQAQFFRFGGRRAPDGGWPEGDYTGTVTLDRNGLVVDESRATVRVDP